MTRHHMRTAVRHTLRDSSQPAGRRSILRNRWLLGACLLAGCAGMLLGQGFSGGSHHSSYDPRKPLPLAMPDAYALATDHIGAATNRFHCVSATCLEVGNQRTTGWSFAFLNADGQQADVKVFLDKAVWLDARSSALLKQ